MGGAGKPNPRGIEWGTMHTTWVKRKLNNAPQQGRVYILCVSGCGLNMSIPSGYKETHHVSLAAHVSSRGRSYFLADELTTKEPPRPDSRTWNHWPGVVSHGRFIRYQQMLHLSSFFKQSFERARSWDHSYESPVLLLLAGNQTRTFSCSAGGGSPPAASHFSSHLEHDTKQHFFFFFFKSMIL